jgi:hypothetical protein
MLRTHTHPPSPLEDRKLCPRVGWQAPARLTCPVTSLQPPGSLPPTRIIVVDRRDVGCVAHVCLVPQKLYAWSIACDEAKGGRGGEGGGQAGPRLLGVLPGRKPNCRCLCILEARDHAAGSPVAQAPPTLCQLAPVAEDEDGQVLDHLHLEAGQVGGLQPKLCGQRRWKDGSCDELPSAYSASSLFNRSA